MSAQFDTVTIVGVGLLGGSLGLALKQRGLAKCVLGLGRRPEPLKVALDRRHRCHSRLHWRRRAAI